MEKSKIDFLSSLLDKEIEIARNKQLSFTDSRNSFLASVNKSNLYDINQQSYGQYSSLRQSKYNEYHFNSKHNIFQDSQNTNQNDLSYEEYRHFKKLNASELEYICSNKLEASSTSQQDNKADHFNENTQKQIQLNRNIPQQQITPEKSSRNKAEGIYKIQTQLKRHENAQNNETKDIFISKIGENHNDRMQKSSGDHTKNINIVQERELTLINTCDSNLQNINDINVRGEDDQNVLCSNNLSGQGNQIKSRQSKDLPKFESYETQNKVNQDNKEQQDSQKQLLDNNMKKEINNKSFLSKLNERISFEKQLCLDNQTKSTYGFERLLTESAINKTDNQSIRQIIQQNYNKQNEPTILQQTDKIFNECKDNQIDEHANEFKLYKVHEDKLQPVNENIVKKCLQKEIIPAQQVHNKDNNNSCQLLVENKTIKCKNYTETSEKEVDLNQNKLNNSLYASQTKSDTLRLPNEKKLRFITPPISKRCSSLQDKKQILQEQNLNNDSYYQENSCIKQNVNQSNKSHDLIRRQQNISNSNSKTTGSQLKTKMEGINSNDKHISNKMVNSVERDKSCDKSRNSLIFSDSQDHFRERNMYFEEMQLLQKEILILELRKQKVFDQRVLLEQSNFKNQNKLFKLHKNYEDMLKIKKNQEDIKNDYDQLLVYFEKCELIRLKQKNLIFSLKNEISLLSKKS